MSSPFVGQIMIFAGRIVPKGWALCDGSLLSIADNGPLFRAIGTAYGGDGKSNFALPDLRGRAPIGQGVARGWQSDYQIGQTVGTETVHLTLAQLPFHSHKVMAVDAPGDSNIPAGNTILANLGGQAASGQFETPAFASKGGLTTLHPATVSLDGGAQQHDNVQPFMAFNFYIAVNP